MKKSFMWSLAIVIFLAMPSLINAQETNAEEERPYNPIADSIAKAITAEFPDWKHKAVPPLTRGGTDKFSQEVIIDQWASKEESVRIAIILNPSEYDAKDSIKQFVVDVKANERLPDVDSEAYAWGMNRSIVLRRGSYTVYISSFVANSTGGNSSSDKKSDDKNLNDERSKDEAGLNKTFAKIVVKALKDMGL
jgi:hypothetical protein